MMSTIPFVMAALLVVVAALVLSPATAAVDECNKKCDGSEAADPARFAECKDQCALEADFDVATRGLDQCNKACEANGGGAAVGKCMEACTAKVDSVVGVIATRACHRDCARTSSKDVGGCEALCKSTAPGKSGNKEVDRLSAELALKKKAIPK